jgi:RNA polymerase sigma-70 factor (ECF subfamily)
LEPFGGQNWEEFVANMRGVIHAAILRTMRQWCAPDYQLADDLVQDVYVRLHKDDSAVLRRFRGERPESLAAYLRTVAASVTVDHKRKMLAKKNDEDKRQESIDDVQNSVASPEAPEEVIQRRILFREIDECLRIRKKVQDRDRSIFWLYYRQGFTSEAISRLAGLNLTSKGVESTIKRLIAMVKDCVSRAGDPVKGMEG